MNIKELRRLLSHWGSYWAKRERPIGYCSVSITAALAESARTGIWSASKDRGQISNSDNLRPPAWVSDIDQIMVKLTPAQRRAVNARYIKKRGLEDCERINLLRAELIILGET